MRWIASGIVLGLLFWGSACSDHGKEAAVKSGPVPGSQTVKPSEGAEAGKVVLSDAEWKKKLAPEAYRVLRKQSTERAFTGKYWDSKKEGTYVCAGCGNELFSSAAKYDSGTGWPSFWEPLAADKVETEVDRSLFGTRTEVHCSRCGGHLGHVFEDGPPPTGLRYCMNSVSLELVEKKKE